MAYYIPNARAIILCDSIVDSIDAGSGAGKRLIYGGSVPADADAALGGATLLAEIVYGDPAYGNAVDDTPGAIATANATTRDEAAVAGGAATFFRDVDSDGNVRGQGTITATGGGGDMELVTTTIVAGQPVEVSSLTIRVPEVAGG